MKNQLHENEMTIQRRIAIARQTQDSSTIESFLNDVEQEVRVAAASNVNAIPEVVALYLRDLSPYVRAAAADNDAISERNLLRAAADEYVIVRESAIANIRRRIQQGKI